MAYQAPAREDRLAAFAQAATTFFDSIDAHLKKESDLLGQFPSLSDKDLETLAKGNESHRQGAYKTFLDDVRSKGRVATVIVDKDPQLVEVFGNTPQAYAPQALNEGNKVLYLRVLNEMVIAAPQSDDVYRAFWIVAERYAAAHNHRRPANVIHTRLHPRGQSYTDHFNDRSKDAIELDYFGLLPLMDREIRSSTHSDLRGVNPKGFMLFGRQLIKGIQYLIAEDEKTAKQRLAAIRRTAIERVSKSERFTRVFQTGQHEVQKILLESSALGDE